ncbi:MAG: threonine/serine exporter family protein [Hespellia sp.]|nr:threonine/serine exporter family protein [Hespellia sp.]
MNKGLYFDTAMLAGEIELCSGSEIYRVEDTMQRILSLTGNGQAEVYATTTGIIATLQMEGEEPLTGVKRIAVRSNNLNRIYQVNEVSRKLCDGRMTIEEAAAALRAIQNAKAYPKWVIQLCLILSVMGFTTLFGGNGYDFLLAGVAAGVMVLLDLLMEGRIYIDFMKDVVKTMGIAMVTMWICRLCHQAHSGVIIISALMPLVPGIPITNAIRDTLQGDYMSGVARMLESLVVAIGIAVGAGAGLGVYHLMEGWLLL